MKRICLILIAIGFIPGLATALGLGKLTQNSGLNQPFEAKIELLSVTAEELSTLQIRLADIDAFRRAHIERPFILSQLRFEVKEPEAGADYLRVYSEGPIREPYLNFLVEANWSKGRLFREYTVLLDPPLYDPYAGKSPAVTQSRSSAPPAAVAVTRESTPVPTQSTAYAGAGGFTGTQYGPVAAGETLWSIATKTRPDASVSIQQMMLALLHANPEAFINNNINGLKRGQVLRMPDRGEVESMDQAQAFSKVRSQNSMWEEVRASVAQAPTVRPVSEGRGMAAPAVTSGEEEGELRLVTPEGEGEGQTGTEAEGELDKNLALATEQLETAAQENDELKSRLKDSDGVINDLKRLVQLKDDELAALQQQIAGAQTTGPGETGEEAATPAPSETESAVEEEQQPQVKQPSESPSVVTTPAPAPAAGILDKVKRLVMDNLIPAAGIFAAVIVVIILLVFISRRKSSAVEQLIPEDEDAAAIDENEVETVFDARHEEVAAAAEVEPEFITEVPEEEQEQEEEEESEARTEFASFEETPEEASAEPIADAAETPAEFEVEPLAEVNVFLAYDNFEQAEEFVRNAIEGNPENLDYHVKLLEVFYTAGNKARYEEEAKVLHDLVNGQGDHWNMVTAMWQEMSPNRALFAEPVEGEEAKVEEQAGGMLDLTAAEGQQAEVSKPGAALDFDFGAGEEAAADDEDVLDISAASPEEDILDVTAAVSSGMQDQDLLDVTAAVGIDAEPESPEEIETPEPAKDEIFDLTTGDDEPVLDITSGSDDEILDFTTSDASSEEEDLLDVSKVSGEDLLDVTSHAEFEKEDMEEDLLDVTSATSAGADSNELLDIEDEEDGTAAATGEDSNAVEFDLTGGESDDAPENEEDNILEFDSGSASQPEEDLTLDGDSTADGELSMEGEPIIDSGEPEGLEIDLSIDEQDTDTSSGLELSLDEGAEEPGFELDLTVDDDASDLSLEDSVEKPDLELDSQDIDSGFELDIDTGDEAQQEAGDLDMESTVQMPNLDLEGDEDDEDDEEEHTVFVPRSSDSQEQSQEDEVATKLDLAKAYVELGDKDSAKGILEEIIADGNEEQQQQAQELLKQV